MNAETAHPRQALGLAGLAAVVTLLAAFGGLPRWPGLTHVVALPPLDLITDLQALLVFSAGWPVFLAGMFVSLVVRSAVLAMLLGGLTRARFLLALRFYLLALPLCMLAAVPLYAAKAVLFYLLFWIGTALALVALVMFGAAPWLAEDGRLRSGFTRAARRGFRAGTLGAYVAVLTVVGFLADVWGPAGSVLLVPVSAALTYGATWVLRYDPGFRTARRAVALAPAAGAVALFSVVMAGPAEAPPAEAGQGPGTRDGSIMVMSGVDSASGRGAILEVDPGYMGWSCDRTVYFSYAGPGDGQPQGDARCPIDHGAPYEETDTLRPTSELVGFLSAMSRGLTAPGVVAGHSQGVWLVWEAAAQGRLQNTDAIVLVGAFPENLVTYAAEGESGGGAVGRHFVQMVVQVPRPGGTSAFDVSSALGREWLGHPNAVEQALAQPLPPDLRALSVASVFDLPMVSDHRIDGATNACPVPVVHPNLPYAAELQDVVMAFLDGEPLPPCPSWRTLIGPLFRHFATPPNT
ncbi:MAG: hypothetical protein AB1673_16545 [Actinomycetota bacterium]